VNERAKGFLAAGSAALGLSLTSAELGKFYAFAAELKKWSRKINLTAIRDDEEVVVKHFLDSLTLLKIGAIKGHLLDLGSGGGFPAIPLKIVCHDLRITSVDAVEKKVVFQRHIARLLSLHGFEALHARGEELAPHHASSFDWVVSRAFSDIPTFVGMALPLIKPEGTIVAMKGRGGRDEARGAEAALRELGAEVCDIIEFPLPVTGDSRALISIGRSRQS
jgi:16S rRNA (guanine527-N7)-methyltransferase